MKKLFISLLALASAFGSYAQSSVFNNPSNKSYFGVRASLDMTMPGSLKIEDKDDKEVISTKPYGTGAGFGLGVIYNLPIVANLYFEPGIDFYYNTVSIKTGDNFDLDPEEDGLKYDNRSIRKFGMRVPLVFGYHFDFSDDVNLAVFTGPVLNVGFSADYYVKGSYEGYEFKETGSLYKVEDDDYDTSYNRFNLDWRIGAGVNFSKFYVGVSGDLGMLNNLKLGKKVNKDLWKETMHTNLFQVTLGYNFK